MFVEVLITNPCTTHQFEFTSDPLGSAQLIYYIGSPAYSISPDPSSVTIKDELGAVVIGGSCPSLKFYVTYSNDYVSTSKDLSWPSNTPYSQWMTHDFDTQSAIVISTADSYRAGSVNLDLQVVYEASADYSNVPG